jgi:hypothetical protein
MVNSPIQILVPAPMVPAAQMTHLHALAKVIHVKQPVTALVQIQ